MRDWPGFVPGRLVGQGGRHLYGIISYAY